MLEFPVLCDQMPYTIVGLPYAAEAATTGTNLDSLVGALVGQMLELQPEGPFRIMGHSFGALLSLQVARHLENSSHVVQSLVLVDPPRLNTAPQGLHPVPVNKSVERLLRLFPHGVELPITEIYNAFPRITAMLAEAHECLLSGCIEKLRAPTLVLHAADSLGGAELIRPMLPTDSVLAERWGIHTEQQLLLGSARDARTEWQHVS